ncbi:uncharacterized protein [Symphalangus syndactylus]|uniref:uncharacterized protein n=1 Tax=Symphalangus syndactylus TaxID=9590 RepID=UPI003006EF84
MRACAGAVRLSGPAWARCLCEDGAAFAAAQTQRASRGRSYILLCTDSGVLRRRSSVLLSTDLGVRARGTARAELRSAQHRPGGHRKGGAPFSSEQTLGALPRFGTTRGSIDGKRCPNHADPQNRTDVSRFLLLELSRDPEMQPTLAGLFLSMCPVTVLGNLLIILAIRLTPNSTPPCTSSSPTCPRLTSVSPPPRSPRGLWTSNLTAESSPRQAA